MGRSSHTSVTNSSEDVGSVKKRVLLIAVDARGSLAMSRAGNKDYCTWIQMGLPGQPVQDPE